MPLAGGDNNIGLDDSGSGGILFPFKECGLIPFDKTNIVVPASNVFIEGNHLRVNIRAKDEFACGNCIGWVNVSITWRAWPAP